MLEAMTMWIADVAHHAAHLAAAVPTPAEHIPNPGEGEEPPFAGPFKTVLRWGVYFALGCGVAGFVLIGGRMAIQHRKGEGGNHMGSMVIVAFGCILITSAYAIVDGLMKSG